MRIAALTQALAAVLLVPPTTARVPQGVFRASVDWIDPDTPEELHTIQVPNGPYSFGTGPNSTYKLIFSDEFSDGNRTFEAGFDRKWTAIDQLDTTNMGQHYFLPQAVQVDKGNLIITTTKPKKKYKGSQYVSGSLQSWNKFCFTGGFVEVQAVLPGKWGIPGTWPALWLMGNLGRAPFLGSEDGMWPWSYDYCAPYIDKFEIQPQKVSACGNLTNKHDPKSYPERYGLNPFQGRGATEIDIIEAQIRARDEPAFISTSLQIRPSLHEQFRPSPGSLPKPGQWYKGLAFGNFTKINSDYYGDAGLDSISAVTQLNTDAFLAYHTYQIDWSPGPYGYLRWFLDGNILFEIPGEGLNVWSDGVPPRMIPTEPSYLILSTAVSERFSPPCQGEICDSIWPSNFTINYVRVYQGNPNNYTSIGCSPAAFPTSGWIFSHPVEYGLPWYSAFDVAGGLTFIFATIAALASLFIAFDGRHHPRFCASYLGVLGFTAGFFAMFSYASVQQMVWVHVAMACLCGVVCGGLCCLVPAGSLGAILGFYGSLWMIQVVASPLLARMMCVVFVAFGISLQYVGVHQKTVVSVSTSLVGSLSFVMSFSYWFGNGGVAKSLWNLVGFLFGGQRDAKLALIGTSYTGDLLALLVVSVASIAFQLVASRNVPTIWEKPTKSRFPKVSASAHARTLRPEESSADKVNFFEPRNLPPSMQKFSSIFRIAMNTQQAYGFQEDSFRNQTEHIVMLLSNLSRKSGDPYRKLHELIFSNYTKWCRKLRIPALQWRESKAPQGSLSNVEEMSVDICLFFFIWGEAGNLRHSPEYLCFLYHKMKEEYPAVRHTTREPGFFLDTVITPVYNLIKSQMASKLDHEYRHNYDDLNEFFWSAECLNYDYKYEEVNESMSPGPMKFFAQLDRANFHPVIYRGKKSIAEAISESSKTFLEKRQWFSSLRAFNRVVEYHIVTFHVLVAIAFASAYEFNLSRSLQIVSSALLTPFVLAVLWDGLDIYAVFQPGVPLVNLTRWILKIILHTVVTVVAVGLYRFAWIHGNTWWSTFYVVVLTLHIPNILSCALQVLPGLNTWLRQTHWKPVAFIRRIVHPMHSLYIGDNVLDPASVSFGYQFFWITLVSWKLYFSYKFEISPLVTPTFLLYADYVENHVSVITTSFLIFLNWLPFFVVFCIDTTIWNSIWNACTGTFVGFSSHIGEVRNFSRVRAGFSRAADMFNAKLVSPYSKPGADAAQSAAQGPTTYGSTIGSHEVLVNESSLSNRSPNGQTPLLSFSRRRQTTEEARVQRRQKWQSFSVAWDAIVECMRADDLVSDKEKALLSFQRIEGYQREIYLPMFQLAGSFEFFASSIQDLFVQGDDISERDIQDKLLELLSSRAMVEESIEELWELTVWLLINIMGPCHTNDIRYICGALSSWVSCGVFRTLKIQMIGECGKALADLVSLLLTHITTWRNNAKFVPARKSPADYSSYQFPQGGVNSLRPIRSVISKSASTTGLSSLGGNNVPRRSRGSGVLRIGSMGMAKPKPKGIVTHSISAAHISQVRDKMRTFFNLTKNMLNKIDETDPLFNESRGVSDRLTWILTQERGFMWDDDYSGEQITLTAFELKAETVVRHIHGLLTLQRIDAEPKSIDAKRRLLSFMNSLFMDMPTAPLLEEMKSWSIITPFYGEDVLYSKSDLESKRDGLDVHTLLFLQTLYKQDWENFLERVKPKKNLWKDPDAANELRLWASLRGQTLARTVQGMMYYEAAIRLLADIEQVPVDAVEDLVKTKFSYVVACQIYGRQKRNNDPKAKDIEFLLNRFPNLRVAYIDEIRVNYQKEQSYYAVLIKSGTDEGSVEEVYRVRLPGNPILGEGKPENQNTAIIFTRGENLQTIDMNQDGYIEEALKMRNALEEFDTGSPDRPYTIVGFPEHIFTGSVSSLANYMALQETSFVTLGQRTLARPLRMRLHYGHPDVFNKLFFMTRGGISKASKGVNLSEDIFAGFNNCLRGGSVKFPEYIKCGKGRDVGMQQIYKFEAKLAQGAAEQSLSRDVYRLSQRLDFFKLLSFFYNHVGFYLSMSMIIWTVYILLYCNLFRAVLTIEGIGGRDPVILSTLQVMLGAIAFFTTAPMFATISVERGFKAAAKEIFRVIVTGGPLYFLFHIGTKWFYYGQTIMAGGAKYRATGRGFVTKHSRFDELFRFYASSHLYASVEIAVGLILYYIHTVGTQYVAMTWSLWLVVVSWSFSPFWFNPLAFEWSDVSEDGRVWLKWMRGDGGNPEQSWQAWFKEENSYFVKLPLWAKTCVALKGLLFAAVAVAIASSGDQYHDILKESTVIPWSICLSILALYAFVSFVFFGAEIETSFARIMKLVIVLITLILGGVAVVSVDGMRECLFSLGYMSAAVGCWGLLLFGTNSRLVRSLYFAQDVLLGTLFLAGILVLSALYVPGKIQTWLLYNNALSRGVVIEDILRSNARNDDREDELSLQQMRSIVVEQQRVIASLTTSSGSDNDNSSDAAVVKKSIVHTLSDHTLHALRNVSETELAALVDVHSRMEAFVQGQEKANGATRMNAPSRYNQPVTARIPKRGHSTSDAGLPPTAMPAGVVRNGSAMPNSTFKV